MHPFISHFMPLFIHILLLSVLPCFIHWHSQGLEISRVAFLEQYKRMNLDLSHAPRVSPPAAFFIYTLLAHIIQGDCKDTSFATTVNKTCQPPSHTVLQRCHFIAPRYGSVVNLLERSLSFIRPISLVFLYCWVRLLIRLSFPFLPNQIPCICPVASPTSPIITKTYAYILPITYSIFPQKAATPHHFQTPISTLRVSSLLPPKLPPPETPWSHLL